MDQNMKHGTWNLVNDFWTPSHHIHLDQLEKVQQKK